jgi:hypothetical protein
MQLLAPDRRLRTAVKHGWTKLVSATRQRHRFRIGRRRTTHVPGGGSLGTAAAQPPIIDPVTLTILAVNRLGPATLRTVAHGRPLSVTVPDERVGAIFRAALAEMQKTRLTDPRHRHRR